MEKNYKDDMSRDECVHFAIKALLEVVQSGSKNIELLVLSFKQSAYMVDEELRKFVLEVEKEKEEEAARKKKQAEEE